METVRPANMKGLKWLIKEFPVPPARVGRKCPRCSCLMSVYNVNKLCFPCMKTIIDAEGDPNKWKGGDKHVTACGNGS
jgi:hypothetical protein